MVNILIVLIPLVIVVLLMYPQFRKDTKDYEQDKARYDSMFGPGES